MLRNAAMSRKAPFLIGKTAQCARNSCHCWPTVRRSTWRSIRCLGCKNGHDKTWWVSFWTKKFLCPSKKAENRWDFGQHNRITDKAWCVKMLRKSPRLANDILGMNRSIFFANKVSVITLLASHFLTITLCFSSLNAGKYWQISRKIWHNTA